MEFEVWCGKTNLLLGKTSIPISGHRDTPITLSREHWYPLGGDFLSNRQITNNLSKRKKMDKKGSQSIQYTGEIKLKFGISLNRKLTLQNSFHLTTMKAIKVEDCDGIAIEDLREKSELLVDESNASASRAFRLAQQSRKIGAEALASLSGLFVLSV